MFRLRSRSDVEVEYCSGDEAEIEPGTGTGEAIAARELIGEPRLVAGSWALGLLDWRRDEEDVGDCSGACRFASRAGEGCDDDGY